MRMKVALGQIQPVLGDLGANLERHLQVVARARAAGAEFVVFPELSLTGYELKDMVPVVATRRDDPRLAPLAEASRGCVLIASGVEEAPDFRYFISAFCWEDGVLRFVHRKVYLPTYGMFDEQRYFASGDRFRSFTLRGLPVGILICEDAWHASAPYLLGMDGAQVQFILTSSPGRGVSGEQLDSERGWQLVCEHTSRFHRCYTVFVNRVGYEDGLNFWGGSRVLDPEGNEVVRAALFEPDLVFAELDIDRVRRARMYTPLLRDEKLALTISELERIHRGRLEDQS